MYWEYDARTAHRWNVDPVLYPWHGGYTVFNNNPIFFVDKYGDENLPTNKDGGISKEQWEKYDQRVDDFSLPEIEIIDKSLPSNKSNVRDNTIARIDTKRFELTPTEFTLPKGNLPSDYANTVFDGSSVYFDNIDKYTPIAFINKTYKMPSGKVTYNYINAGNVSNVFTTAGLLKYTYDIGKAFGQYKTAKNNFNNSSTMWQYYTNKAAVDDAIDNNYSTAANIFVGLRAPTATFVIGLVQLEANSAIGRVLQAEIAKKEMNYWFSLPNKSTHSGNMYDYWKETYYENCDCRPVQTQQIIQQGN